MTTPEPKVLWTEANQASLTAELARLKHLLGCTTAGEGWDEAVTFAQPSAIDSLSELFGLSPFERDVLLLCAGVEMDSHLAARCGEAQGHPQRAYATFGLALSTLPEAHWSALTPDRPLRRFRLLEVEPGHSLTTAPLRIDERILHYLAGVNLLDHRLQSLLQDSCIPGVDRRRACGRSGAGGARHRGSLARSSGPALLRRRPAGSGRYRLPRGPRNRAASVHSARRGPSGADCGVGPVRAALASGNVITAGRAAPSVRLGRADTFRPAPCGEIARCR